jgi:ABC-type transporter Mla MlaB component
MTFAPPRSHYMVDSDSHEPLLIAVEASGLRADAATIDALARAQLLARRRGWEIVISGASGELESLIELAGLRDVLPGQPAAPQ